MNKEWDDLAWRICEAQTDDRIIVLSPTAEKEIAIIMVADFVKMFQGFENS